MFFQLLFMDLHFIYIWCLIKSPLMMMSESNLRVGPRSTECTGIGGFFPMECSPFNSSIWYLLPASRARVLPQSVGILLIKPYVLVHACFWRLNFPIFFFFQRTDVEERNILSSTLICMITVFMTGRRCKMLWQPHISCDDNLVHVAS